ncbi:MAG: hypothetical protein ACI3ZT_02630 [Candidatus Cryptobacteroides sp.]
MKTFAEKERICEASFLAEGPYWHAYTSGKETPVIFVSDGDMAFAMNLTAQAAALNRSVSIIAFEVMNNHFHFVINAQKENIPGFWSYFSKRLARFFPQSRDITLNIKPIDSLKSLRNTIVYTHRNGYVTNPDFTPFSYPWGSGRYYYNDIPCGKPVSQIQMRQRRDLFHCRFPEIPDGWIIGNQFVLPTSYCSIQFGMSLFRDAHHYFSLVSKNIEAYSEIADGIDDGEFLTDSELFGKLASLLKSFYHASSTRELSRAQKLDIARKLHYEFRSSNGQIRRLLGLSQYDIDRLFPLSSEK